MRLLYDPEDIKVQNLAERIKKLENVIPWFEVVLFGESRFVVVVHGSLNDYELKFFNDCFDDYSFVLYSEDKSSLVLSFEKIES